MTVNQIDNSKAAYTKRLVTFVVLFFMWGLLTVLNFELIEHLKLIFNLSYITSTLINITFFAAYLIISVHAGTLIKKVGYKRAIITGWLLACLGCFIFFYSVVLKNYEYYLGALFVLAAGITILQVGANLYVVLLGDTKNAASRLTLVQAFNSLGTFIAPLFASSVLSYHTEGANTLKEALSAGNLLILESDYVHYPYLYLGILMLFFAVFLMFADIPNINTSEKEPLNKITSLRRRHAMHFPQLRLGAFAIFAYVGAEVALANYLEQYNKELTHYYWGAAMIGRFIGSFLLTKFSVRLAVTFNACVSILLIIAFTIFIDSAQSMWLIVMVGLFNSILFPSLFTLGLNGLGKYSIDGSAILIMFIVGGAVIPFNVINYSYVSLQVAFMIPVICYIYIAIYAYRLSRFEVRDDIKELHKHH